MSRASLVALVMVVQGAACSTDSGSARTTAGGARTVDTLITTVSAVIGEVSDLTVAADGSVYLADRLGNAVHVIAPTGELVRTMGREGSGPGDLKQPSGILLSGDTVVVVDYGNNRVQLLTPEGTAVGTRPLPGAYTPAVSRTGWIVRSTLTMDTTLASVHDPTLDVKARIGRIVGTPSNTVSLRLIREDIARGAVPQILLNTAESVWAPDESIWLIVPARGTVERYERSGALRWTLTLGDPDFPAVRDEFVRRNATVTRGIVPLRYVLAARSVGDELWLLLGQSTFGPAVIQAVGADGTLGRRMSFPDVEDVVSFAVDGARGLVYFTTADTAELLRVALDAAR